MTYFTTMTVPVGELLLIGDAKGLSHLHICSDSGRRQRPDLDGLQSDPGFLEEAVSQLRQYFQGQRRTFRLPLNPAGTPFQLEVWRTLQTIGYGKVESYGAVAKRMGKSGAARAVGAAGGRNPLPILIPCHRVVGADGGLTGFAFGLEVKEALLHLEGYR